MNGVFGEPFRGPVILLGSMVKYHLVWAKDQSRLHKFRTKARVAWKVVLCCSNRASICSHALILLSQTRWIVMTGWCASISLQPFDQTRFGLWFLVVYKHRLHPVFSNTFGLDPCLRTRIWKGHILVDRHWRSWKIWTRLSANGGCHAKDKEEFAFSFCRWMSQIRRKRSRYSERPPRFRNNLHDERSTTMFFKRYTDGCQPSDQRTDRH